MIHSMIQQFDAAVFSYANYVPLLYFAVFGGVSMHAIASVMVVVCPFKTDRHSRGVEKCSNHTTE